MKIILNKSEKDFFIKLIRKMWDVGYDHQYYFFCVDMEFFENNQKNIEYFTKIKIIDWFPNHINPRIQLKDIGKNLLEKPYFKEIVTLN